ncbi:MAG: hypothetical protein Q9160_006446 [Pyrenula sp. 1 TL-2023]
MNDAIEEAIKMATRAKERFESKTDTDYENVFKYLFKVEKANADKMTTDFLKDVSEARLADRNAANVRIYCDQDARFKQRIDPKTKVKVGGFEDPDNWIQYPAKHDFQTTGCLDTHGLKLYTMAQTYKIKMEGEPPQKQEENRATVTMCDMSFFTLKPDNSNDRPRKGILEKRLKEGADLTTQPLEFFKDWISKIFLHELGHCLPWSWSDLNDGHFGVLWDNVRKAPAGVAKRNPDTYAYFGQLALMADRGYTLSRPPPEGSLKEEIDKANQERDKGTLKKYEKPTKRSLTKRSLERRLRRIARYPTLLS